jgi:hypothetical protein
MYRGEFYTLALFALLGQMVMISSNNLLVVYLGLELMSLSLYALAALRRDSGRATEAAIKYFVLGALASGFLLYGMSMVYGGTGSLDLPDIAKAFSTGTGQPHGDGVRRGVHRGRPGVQVRRGAVPHVGARRVPGHAHRGHAADRRRAQAGRLRDPSGCWPKA